MIFYSYVRLPEGTVVLDGNITPNANGCSRRCSRPFSNVAPRFGLSWWRCSIRDQIPQPRQTSTVIEDFSWGIKSPNQCSTGALIEDFQRMGLSENRVYPQWNSHLIGIMISKTIGFRGTHHFQTHPHPQPPLNDWFKTLRDHIPHSVKLLHWLKYQ